MSTDTTAPIHPYFVGQAAYVLAQRFGAERAATADPMPLARWAEANHAADHHRRHGVIVDAHGALHLCVRHSLGPAGAWYAREALSDQGRAAMGGSSSWVADFASARLQHLLREEEGLLGPCTQRESDEQHRLFCGQRCWLLPSQVTLVSAWELTGQAHRRVEA